MRNIFIDFETRSSADLPKCGVHKYAKDAYTDILCLGYANQDGPVKIWTPHDWPILPLFFDDIKECTLIAHNASFEFEIWNTVGVAKYGFPQISRGQLICTMAMSLAMAIPASLDNSSAAMGLDIQKDMHGHRIMLQLSQPRRSKDGTVQWWDDPEKFEKLYSYCKTDIEVERKLFNRLMMLSGYEKDVWILDQTINDRGIAVDLKAVKAAIQIVNAEKHRLNLKMAEITGGAVSTCTATGQLTDWLKWQGLRLDGVAKADVIELLETDIPDVCRKALLLRQEAAKSSTAKLEAMVASAGADGRIRGLFQYSAATTGRWGGRRIQPQNFPRPKLDSSEIEAVFGILGEIDE